MVFIFEFIFELSSYVIVLDLLQDGIGFILSCLMIGFFVCLFVCLFVFVFNFSIFVWVTLSHWSQVVCP